MICYYFLVAKWRKGKRWDEDAVSASAQSFLTQAIKMHNSLDINFLTYMGFEEKSHISSKINISSILHMWESIRLKTNLKGRLGTYTRFRGYD